MLASMMAASVSERRGKLSLKRNRNVFDGPSTSFEKPPAKTQIKVCGRGGICNSRVDPQMCVGDQLRRVNMFGANEEFRQSQEWTSLPDFPPWFGFKGKEKEETPKPEIIKMGTVSIEWRPLPKHCQLCLVRTRRKTQLRELSTGPLSLQTQSATAVSDQVPASVQRSKTSRNGSEHNVTAKETARESYPGRTVRKEDLPVNDSENHLTPPAKNAGVASPLQDKHSKSFVSKIDAGKLQMKKPTIERSGAVQNLGQDLKKEHFQDSKDKSVELIEEIDVERGRSRRENMQGSHSSTVKNVDLGRKTVRKEDLPVNGSENHSKSQAKNAGVALPSRGNYNKSSKMKIDAEKLQMKKNTTEDPGTVHNPLRLQKNKHLQASKSETKIFKALPASSKLEGKDNLVELIEEFDVERERSRRENIQRSHSATVQNVDPGRRTVRKEDLLINSSENHSKSQAKIAGDDLPSRDNHSKSFNTKIDAGKLQMNKNATKDPGTVHNLPRHSQAAKSETKGFNALPAKNKSVELIEEYDVERERSRRKNGQGSNSSIVKNADSKATKILEKNSSKESYANLSVKDSNSMNVKSKDTNKELIGEFDLKNSTLKRSCQPESKNSTSHYQTSDGKTSVKTVNQRLKDQLPSGSVEKCFPSPPAKKKSKKNNVDLPNSSKMSHFNKHGSKVSSPWSSEKPSSQLDKVSWKASPARGETLNLIEFSPEIIVLDSDDDDEILPPSPIKQSASSWSTSKRKLSETSSEKDGTPVKKPKLADSVSTGPGTSGSLAKGSIPDQRYLSMAGQKQSCGNTTTSQTIKTVTGMKTTEIRNDSRLFPNIATKKPLFKRKADKAGGETRGHFEKFSRKTDGSSGSIRVPNLETQTRTTLPNRQNFTKTHNGKITASASKLSKSPGGKTPNTVKHFGQKASKVEYSYITKNPSQVVRGPETQRRVPEVANQWTAKTNQSGFQTAKDIRTNLDVQSRPNAGNHQGSYPKQGITTHTPFKGTNQDNQHPNRGINQDQQANQSTKPNQTFKRYSNQSQVVEACPLCTIKFEQGLSQMQRDGHIAECLYLSGADATW